MTDLPKCPYCTVPMKPTWWGFYCAYCHCTLGQLQHPPLKETA